MKGIINRKAILYWLYLFLIVFIGLEILLRIYNPFGFRIKGDSILLPVNQKQVYRNTINPRLDKEIVNTRNGLGFRGPDTPVNFSQTLSVITVGGSTTECRFLSDSLTWPYRLGQLLQQDFRNVWLNNAGLDGHSTFGHQVLLKDHISNIKPKVIMFLVGMNDIESDQPSFHDKLNDRGAFPDLKHYIYNHSEVINLVVNLFRGWRAQRFNNTTQELRLPNKNSTLFLQDSVIENRLNSQEKYLIDFRKRVNELIDSCRSYHIQPVFITQPNLYGYGIDSITQAVLAKSKLEADLNGELLWKILEKYNDQTRIICKEKKAPLIDLAMKMPKNSYYYYDNSHYTNEGAQKVAELLYMELKPIFNNRFPTYERNH